MRLRLIVTVAFSVKAAVVVLLFNVAVSVAVLVEGTEALVLTVKVTDVEPAGTRTVAGTVA